MSKRYNEKRQALAQAAIDRELDQGYGKEDFADNAAKDSRDAAMGKGEDELYEKKMSKAERKAAAKAAREAKRKKKGLTKNKSSDDVKEFGQDDANGTKKNSDKIILGPNASAE